MIARGRTFRHTPGSRAVSAGCAALFVLGAVSTAAAAGPTPAFFVLAGLALLGAINLVTTWGDRFVLGEEGIESTNALLGRLGQRPRRVPWESVVAVREHRRLRGGRPEGRPSVLFLTPRSGRRVVLDSIEDYDEALALVRRHCAAARQ
jgi:hypothetical protein